MKIKLLLFLFLLAAMPGLTEELDGDKIFDIKQNAFALYNTNHSDEAYEILNSVPNEKKDEEIYLMLANIEEDRGKDDRAITYLNSSIVKNKSFYKAYYNLGCIFMKKRIYTLAIENFELAAKYNKENPYILYNLGCAQMNMGEFKNAKKNFIKAIYLKNDEKNFYYNLAYVNKKLGKEKDSKKIIDFYNQTFIK